MTIFIIFILFAAVLFLSAKLFNMKRQIRNITGQLENQKTHNGYLLSIDLADNDVEEMAVQVNEMLAKMQRIKADAHKKEAEIKSSIAVMSHDMRTPLTSVIGYLQLAEKNCREEETLQNIRIAKERADYCNKLIHDFFELSAAESGACQLKMQKVDISALLCEQILANYPNFEKKKITPVFEQKDKTFYVQADRELLERVIQNLISNSIKYSSGTVVFQLVREEEETAPAHEGGSIILTIANSIEQPVDAEKIFDRFYRADGARSLDGSGLGLYICRLFLERMGGTVSAECKEGMFVIRAEL